MLPVAKMDPNIEKKSRRNVLTTGAAAAFPFSSFELCDDKGVLLGINLHNNSAVFLDNYNADLYSNGNFCIFGMTGAGKTYTILLLAMRLRMCGVQVFVIAPEKGFEYREACEALGGQYVKLARRLGGCHQYYGYPPDNAGYRQRNDRPMNSVTILFCWMLFRIFVLISSCGTKT